MNPTTEQLIDRGRAAFQGRDYVAALADFRKVLESHPDFADIHNLTGLCLSFLGQPDNALEEFDRALALNEHYIEALLNRAITLNELGRYDEARGSFERASHFEGAAGGRFPAAVSARLANAHMNVGDLYLEAGAPEAAIEQYRTALSMRPEFHDVRNKLAEALMRLERWREADTELRAVLEGNPHFLSARLNLGLVHYSRGDAEKARLHWERAQQESPSSPQARAYLSLLEREAPGRRGAASE